ncbi:MAG: hypothetical protein GXY47_08915 [Acidobacteria bacterium]|nr:hypothetical protein [Acidobacteriota bacterium]
MQLQKERIIIGFIVAAALCIVMGCSYTKQASFGSTDKATLELADAAHRRMDLHATIDILTRLTVDAGSSADDKEKAFARLALLRAYFYKDNNSAVDLIQKALSISGNQPDLWTVQSRIHCLLGQYQEAEKAAQQALALAKTTSEILAARLALGLAVHDHSMRRFRAGEAPDDALLREGREALCAVLAVEPGQPRAAELLLGISLFLGDGPTAQFAWRQFFRLPAERPAVGILAQPSVTLARILPHLHVRPLSREQRRSLIEALAQSRFYDYASLIAASSQFGKDPDIAQERTIKDIVVYDGFISRLRTLCEEFYRNTAVASGLLDSISFLNNKDKAFRRDQDEEMQRLWQELSFPEGRPAYSVSRFKDEMLRRFGLDWWGDGKTNGYTDILAGHRISDENRKVEQYGYSADIRLVVDDQMISAGYSSWFWSSLTSSMVGGTADSSTIFVFRPAYVEQQYQEWRNAADEGNRAKVEARISQLLFQDDALAAKNPYGYLPGLDSSLRHAATMRIYHRIAAGNLAGADLCIAFINEFSRVQDSYLVFAHEGRHLIDKKYFLSKYTSWGAMEQERRAKLSQIVFAADPKLAFTGILSPYIGDPKIPHAMADEMIVKGYVQWMSANSGKIPGLNPSRPLLPQFNLLSDEQVRQIARNLDPLANEK